MRLTDTSAIDKGSTGGCEEKVRGGNTTRENEADTVKGGDDRNRAWCQCGLLGPTSHPPSTPMDFPPKCTFSFTQL